MTDEVNPDREPAIHRMPTSIDPSLEGPAGPAPYTCKHGCERDEIMDKLHAALSQQDAMREAFISHIKEAQCKGFSHENILNHVGTLVWDWIKHDVPIEALARTGDDNG